MIAASTRYERASDVDHALELLGEPDAKAIAGGQSLIPVMKLRIARPSVVVDISRLELRGVEQRDGALHIGPLTTWSELAAWLRDNLYSLGRKFTPKETIERITGSPTINSQPYLVYLRDKLATLPAGV